MLKIYFGSLPGELRNPTSHMRWTGEDSWFDDPFIKQMIMDVDKTEVISANNMLSPVLGSINRSLISGGVNMLILAYKLENPVLDGSACGDNCAKWFIEIGKRKDITISLCHPMLFEGNFEALILNDNVLVHNFDEYLNYAIKYT